MGSLSGHFGGRVGVILGVILGSLWGHFGVISGSFWVSDFEKTFIKIVSPVPPTPGDHLSRAVTRAIPLLDEKGTDGELFRRLAQRVRWNREGCWMVDGGWWMVDDG